MKHSTAVIMILCVNLSMTQTGHFLADAAENAGQAAPTAASTIVQQWMQQGRAYLAKNRYAEAVQCFEKATATPADATTSYEARRLLTDTYTAWLQSVQVTRYHVSGQVASAQERLNQVQLEVDQARRALAVQVTKQKQAQSSRSDIPVEAISQANRNTYELKILSGTATINNQTRLIATLKQQLNALEVQINDIQSRVPNPTILKIIEAKFGLRDVTAAVQELVHGDRATICASASALGVPQNQSPDAALKISYELLGEKKEISVPHGWTVKLPSGRLESPPPSAPESPWYEKHVAWLVGGTVALLLIVTTIWQPKPKDREQGIGGDE
ncbi:MAG: hypothetical protein WC740_06065 [Verrucomicrobiia bacterium]